MSSQSTFQAKLLTAAGDQITKTIKTLDKDDIKVAFTTISGKFRSKEAKKDDVPTDLVKKEVKVSGHEDNAALVAQEFDIFNLKDRRGESGNYKSFEYIDYDKDAKVFGPENQEVDSKLFILFISLKYL